jgi:hypothetical protein
MLVAIAPQHEFDKYVYIVLLDLIVDRKLQDYLISLIKKSEGTQTERQFHKPQFFFKNKGSGLKLEF